ncbi:preprotein translocase subunit SecG [Geobacter pelophilus]|uniref:Protein-export membrane protein SecG n=1 Tax=Geoanaerobacter pelophilus TaxID=60036 RepID=A0AAW4L480_9BACT|nr:preprotein translocase subunit SecG [Geoanaerobacter pelophilus]MBT0664340.1 preprotein translocase subunit SecG [Geoanaerobacter pelophilus]
MTYVLVFLHVLVCIALIAIVLLQSGKGAEMGASFGASGSQSVFGAGGGNTFMSKLTTGAAIIFMLTSLTLAYRSGHTGSSSVMSGKAAQKAAPAQKPAPMGGMQSPAAPQPQTAPPAMPAAPAPNK